MIATYRMTTLQQLDRGGTMQTFLGLDSGNGFIKAITDKQERVILPSIIASPSEYFDGGVVAQNGVSVLYAGGSRSDLIDQRILVGEIAYNADPLNHISIAKHPQAKADYALELLLGAVGLLPQSDRLIIPVISIHDSNTFGDQIKQQIEGIHRVVYDSQGLTLEIKNTAISPEGMGVYYYLLKSKKVSVADLILLLDLGFGTSIYTAFIQGQILDRKVFRWGVRDLLGYIAQAPALRKALSGVEGDTQVLRSAIENKTYSYRTEDGEFDFRDQYQQALNTWATSNLKQALDVMRPRLPKANHLFLAGGGASLPGIAKFFTRKKFEVLENNQTINAEGNLAIALHRNGGKN